MSPRRAWMLDIAIVVALTALTQVELWTGETYEGVTALPGNRVLTCVLLLIATGSLLWRRRAPTVVYASCTGALTVMLAIQGGGEFGGGFFLILVAGYSAGAWGARPLPVLAATVAFLAVHAAADVQVTTIMDGVYPGMFMAAGYVFGRVLRTRLRRAVTAEHGTAEAVAAERARLARELHDVVAHSVSVMVMQAKGGAAVLDTDPDRAREALATIESSGRQAIEELRRMLGLLAGSQDTGDDARHAQPGLDRLDDLVRATRMAGVTVDVHQEGTPGTLAAVADLSAYRIVQEGLTNVVRHAGAARAEVQLRWSDGELRITVRDDGRGVVALDLPSGGRGLVGMRERVAMLGGTLAAAPRAEGGFEISAVLPLTAG